MQLFEFAYCPNYDTKISILATLCPEKWSFGTNSDNVILKNYIKHTFSKLDEEGKTVCPLPLCRNDFFCLEEWGTQSFTPNSRSRSPRIS